MKLSDWAENEVRIACKKEAPDRKEGEWDYGCACYESALKAFKSLMEDGHSGYSIGFTKNILNRLIDGKPLTPITEEDFYIPKDSKIIGDNPKFLESRGLKSSIQCPRMSSLFRDEKLDGTIEYVDINRATCIDINDPDISYHNNFIVNIALKDFPIELPYYPTSNKFCIYSEDFLADKTNTDSDYDTIGIHYMITPEFKRIEINRYFKGDKDDEDWTEISKEVYYKRKYKALYNLFSI